MTGDAFAEVQARRSAYWQHGYRPIEIWGPDQKTADDGKPLKNPGKQPRGRWREAAAQNPPRAVTSRPDKRALSTGLTCGELVGLDVDILDHGLADQVVALAEAALGITPLIRVGLPPKTLLAYRVEKTFAKIQTPEMVFPDGSKCKVELLAEGQQFVVDGIHPDTREPYHWMGEGTPETIALLELPVLAEETARRFIEEVEVILRAAGAVPKKRPGRECEPVTNNPHPRGPSGGDGFFRAVNVAALANIAAWAPILLPAGHWETGTGAWRVSSKALYRDLEEDLSIHPSGIQDWGREEPYTPIDTVMSYTAEFTRPLQAALWLCERLHIDPASIGGTDLRYSRAKRRGHAPGGAAGPSAAPSEADEPRRRGNGGAWRELEFIFARDMRPQLESSALIKGIIDREQISLLLGSRGCGKTFLAIDRDLSIATGLSWFGHKIKPGPVVYLAIEAGARIIQNRASAWLQAHDMAGQDVPFVAIPTPVDLCHIQVGDVPLLIWTIQQRIGFDTPVLLEIDTVSRALAGGDENAPDDMGAFVYALDQIRAALHCHVSGIHHTGKTDGKGSRGHSLLPAAVDTEQEIAKLGDTGTSSYTVTRQRDGVAGEKVYFELPQVVLGEDEDGDRITTCVVKQVEAPSGANKANSVKLSDADRIALTQLSNAINTAGIVPSASNHIPTGKTGVLFELWREYSYAGGISGSDKPDSQLKAFNRSAQKLVANGLVGRHLSMVWIP
jgi:hypothetical protein